jgi:Uma2 family endonuclease
MSTQPTNYITPEQYLEIDSKAEIKSEYVYGEMFAMAGAGRVHNLLAGNVADRLRAQLRTGNCEAYQSDMRVRINAAGLFAYPDVVVACDPQFVEEKQYTLVNPSVIVEVLSPSTEAYDLRTKFKYYREIESFREYLLVASESVDVELWNLESNGKWVLSNYDHLDDEVELQSIGCRLALRDIYEKIELGVRPPHMRPLNI